MSRDLFKLANFMFALFVEFVFLFQFLFRFVLFCFFFLFWVSFRQRFYSQCRVSQTLSLSLPILLAVCCTVWATRVLLPHKFKQQHPKNVLIFVEGKGQSQLLAVILNTPHTHPSVCMCVCVD